MLLIPTLIMLAGVPGSGLMGAYVVDASDVARANRSVVTAYFKGELHLEADGKFELPTINMQGFWRVDGDRVVLTYSTTINGPPVMEPDDVIKKSVVRSPFDGHVMKVQRDGTLILADFGACPGPIYFRRAPEVSIKKLAEESQLPMPGPGLEPFATLQDEAPWRWKEAIAVIQDPTVTFAGRFSAAFALRAALPMQAERDVLDCLESLNETNLKGDEASRLRRQLARSVAGSGASGLVIGLMADRVKFGIPKAILAEGIAKANLKDEIPTLLEWAHSDNAEDAVAAMKALIQLGATEAMVIFRAQATAQDPDIKVAGNAGVLRMSSDSAEQSAAIATLDAMKGLAGHAYINTDIIQALGESHSILAVTPLLDFLTKSVDEFDRRKAAEALGNLGFPEALPSLRVAAQPAAELKLDRSQSVEQQYAAVVAARNRAKNDGWVRKNAVEAIWKIERFAKR